jgi:hypothetical protein
MFYTQQQLLNKFECLGCEETLMDPRNLPCGQCLCNNCIELRLPQAQYGKFDCLGCENRHSIPDDGFPVNKILVSLLNEKPEGQFKMNSFEIFKEELEEMKDTLDTLICKVRIGDKCVDEYCEIIKSQIEMQTKSIIRKIEKCKKTLLNDVDECRNKCKRNIIKNQYNCDKTINESTKLFNDYTLYINKQKIDENDIIKMNENTIIQKAALQNELKNYNYLMLNEKKLKFKKNVDTNNTNIVPSMIGTLIHEPISVAFNLSKSTKIFSLRCRQFKDFKQMLALNNGGVVIFHTGCYDKYHISVFNKDFDFLTTSSISNFSANSSYSHNSKERIALCYYNETKNYCCLDILDQNLSIQKSINCEKLYSSIDLGSNNVIGLYKGKLDVYDLTLNLTKQVGQPHISNPFYIDPQVVYQVKILSNHYILRSKDEIRIINLESGIEQASIKVESHQIILNENRIILVVYQKSSDDFELHIYNLNGKLRTKYLLNHFTSDSLLSYRNNKIDFLLNKKTLRLKKY